MTCRYNLVRVCRFIYSLIGFNSVAANTKDRAYKKTTMIEFQVVSLKMLYIIILGRHFLKKPKTVESIHYLKLKFRVNEAVGVVKWD